MMSKQCITAVVPPTPSAADPQIHFCAVCGCVGAAFFCAVFSCRPCASFFRRSVKDRREYKCRANDICPIDKNGMRNCCRACRLRRCFEAGMLPELVANDHVNFCPSSKLKSPAFSSNFLEKSTRQKHAFGDAKIGAIPSPQFVFNASAADAGGCLPFLPATTQICQLFREFYERQKAICAQHFGIGTVLGNKLRPITHEEYSRIERCSVMLLLNFVRTIFPQIDLVPTQQKIQILKTFTFHFNVLHSCELTIKHFPVEGDLRQFVILPGCLFELDQFATTLTGPGKQQQMALFWSSIFEQLFSLHYAHLRISTLKKSRVFSVSEIKTFSYQFSGNVCLPISTDFGECSEILGTASNKPVDTLFFELHSLIATSPAVIGNSKAIAVRFGRILSMLSDVSDLGRDMNELFTLCKVFLDPESCVNSNDLWDEMFAEKSEKNSEK